jgi:hypothetical protein
MPAKVPETTYVLPIRRDTIERDDDLTRYLAALAELLPVLVVDGSPPEVFAYHATALPPSISHVALDDDRRDDANGKVAGVVTGLRRVRTEKAVIADDDVRWGLFELRRIAAALDDTDVVRPQNVFVPLTWHALLETGRTLVARASGGDWPGTLGLRMTTYAIAGGYDGGVLFENLELVRTIRAVGGRERVLADLFVARRPPTTRRYLSQRVRQAYDELGRPGRFAAELALAPALSYATLRWGVRAPAALALATIAAAEIGRRHRGGRRVFPFAASLCAPGWVFERAFTAWCALGLRTLCGGVRYSRGRLRVAAHSERTLRRRFRRGQAA